MVCYGLDWRFNTQPPEGGWPYEKRKYGYLLLFQHTAARRRLVARSFSLTGSGRFQHTAARRRLADSVKLKNRISDVSTHSRPKAAGYSIFGKPLLNQRFNTQPPEGGWVNFSSVTNMLVVFQHTAARRRLGDIQFHIRLTFPFQHTAARRRLDVLASVPGGAGSVSTHSRPKAAGSPSVPNMAAVAVSTHSRPKAAGGKGFTIEQWRSVSTHSRPKAAGSLTTRILKCENRFNTQPPEGGWVSRPLCVMSCGRFNTQPPEGGWVIYFFLSIK